jgi:glycosyltransferase involved in cell wall biosynthesis
MKLLICTKTMNCAGGGAERVLAEVASGLATRGHDVTILSFDQPRGSSFYPLQKSIRRIDLALGSTTRPSGLLDSIARMRALRSKILRLAPDVAIGFMHSMFVPLSLSMLGTNVPLIASEHTVYDHYRHRPLQKTLLRLSSRLAVRITCTSQQALLSYPRRIQRKMVVVRNPVRVDTASRADALGSERARKILLSVGRLEIEKDHAVLIDAFSRIAERVPDWDLRIVGEGALREQLEAQISALGLANRVQLPGSTSEISKEYLSAQLFVVPSRYESFGLATAEALAYGLCVVGFADCPGTNQLVHGGKNGILADGSRGRAASLAAVLHSLMTNDRLRARLSGKSHDILDDFSLEHVLDCWERLIEDAVSG